VVYPIFHSKGIIPVSTSPQLRFDYDSLDRETRIFLEERAERIRTLARMTAAGIVQIGQYLTEVKERLKHGKFLDWIEREFAWKKSTAENFMLVYENVKNSQNLGIWKLTSRPSMPSTPEPVRVEALRRAQNGEADPRRRSGSVWGVRRYRDDPATGKIVGAEDCTTAAGPRTASVFTTTAYGRGTETERTAAAGPPGKFGARRRADDHRGSDRGDSGNRSFHEGGSVLYRSVQHSGSGLASDCREALFRITSLCKELGL
jgi:hypothetical protein